MLFNSIDFLVFLPIVLILYFITPYKYRWVLLLAASYYFYMSWKAEYLLLILLSTIIDFYAGIRMGKRPTKRARRPFLILSLATNLGLLFSFKYFNFFSASINEMLPLLDIGGQIPMTDLLLPVGISFYTFQTLSYSIDVYNGRQAAERHLGYFALYVSFFPQLVAGPIERFSRLSPQLKQSHTFSYENMVNGLRLILYGLFIKMVIADNLAIMVDQVYAHPELYASHDVLLGILFYSFQIYCDFYGYSIIAIGSALIMGIRIMDNFRTPYLAKNIAEFWQRWHISLSTWFRDYLYFPLGGNRGRKLRWMLNILIVFVVSGVWHGANWTFLIWGFIFGMFYLCEKLFNRILRPKKEISPFSLLHILLAVKTFLLVTLIWVFFRSQSLGEALDLFGYLWKNGSAGGETLLIPPSTWILTSLFVLSDLFMYNTRFDRWIGDKALSLRWSIYGFLLFSIIVFTSVENIPFIYFQF